LQKGDYLVSVFNTQNMHGFAVLVFFFNAWIPFTAISIVCWLTVAYTPYAFSLRNAFSVLQKTPFFFWYRISV